MKRKLAWITPITILIILVAYLFLTPLGALQFAVAKEGYPTKAITLRLADEPYQVSIKENQTMYTISNPPHENATDSDLVNWVVSKKSIFYFGSYYGW
jgi:hypothetical protein